MAKWTPRWYRRPNERRTLDGSGARSLVQALATRVVTATVLGSFVVAGVLYLPLPVMAALFAVAAFVGALEWAALAGAATRPARLFYAAVTVALAALVHLACREAGAGEMLLLVACAWWMVATAWVVSYQLRGAPALANGMLLGACGWLVLIPAVSAVWLLQEQNPRLLLALFALVWSADVLAFFGGKALGRRRLASRVSPGKTWEGLVSAVAGTLLLSALAAHWLRPGSIAMVVGVAAATVLAAVVGDLLESLMKRLRGVKDSGTLLPGHGGMLDRIDSLLAAAPVFTFGVSALGPP